MAHKYYDKNEREIIKATKEFAKNNEFYFDEIVESMIINAMRELKLRLSKKRK